MPPEQNRYREQQGGERAAGKRKKRAHVGRRQYYVRRVRVTAVSHLRDTTVKSLSFSCWGFVIDCSTRHSKKINLLPSLQRHIYMCVLSFFLQNLCSYSSSVFCQIK